MAPQTTDISPTTLKAVGHPLRIQMLGVLGERPHARSELARRLDVEVSQVDYHARKLVEVALISEVPRPDRSSERVYRLVALPRFSPAAWEQTPSVARHALAAAMVNQMHATAVAAIPHGGFDRGNMHASRRSAQVDEETWNEIASELERSVARIDELCEQGRERVERGADPVNATAQMLLFTTPKPQDDADESVPGPRVCDAQLDRVYELAEALAKALIVDNKNALDAAVPLLDELRVVLMAGLLARREHGASFKAPPRRLAR